MKKINKKKIVLMIILTIGIILILVGIILGIIKLVERYRIAHATVLVVLKENLDVEVYKEAEVKDFITKLNGELITNYKVDTSELGKKEISFEYINDENIKIPYTIEINVVDKTPPQISTYNNVYVYTDEVNFVDDLFCGDNYDDEPKCYIEGEYDINTPNTYNVTLVGEDSSGNKNMKNMNLVVRERSKSNTNNTTNTEEFTFSSSSKEFSEIRDKYKNENTLIGIDVSKWQGNIDFSKVKEAGVEFAMLRVGIQKGLDGEYNLDTKFKDYIEGFTKEDIPVGVYFFSYANSKEEAKKQAKWVIKQIKKYDIDLPVAFDWENWDGYRNFNVSFHTLNEVANEFMDVVESKGYDSMLYSSKNYLNMVWKYTNHDVWLAHYTEQTDYDKDYIMWQLTEKGKVPGIEGNYTDINILYKDKIKTKR